MEGNSGYKKMRGYPTTTSPPHHHHSSKKRVKRRRIYSVTSARLPVPLPQNMTSPSTTTVPDFQKPPHPLPFGRSLLPYFQFPPSHTEINHGSFGTYPAAIHSILLYYRTLAEQRPDHFNRQGFKPPLDASRSSVSSLLNVDVDTVVFIPNATTGVNTVLRSLCFKKGDVILSFSTIYGACGKTVAYIVDSTDAESYVVRLCYPMSGDEVLDGFRGAVEQCKKEGKNIVVAVFDVISSLPGVRMPFEKLAEACRREGILSLVDGAHGIGHVPLNLGKLQPDFFVSNCHKWLFVPRGCAVLYVPLKNQHLITTSIPTSHYYVPKTTPAGFNPLGVSGKSNFVEQFEFNGTVDASQFYCVEAAIRWRRDVLGGEERILKYCHDLASAAGRIISSILQTDVMTVDKSTSENGRCCFATIRLPINASKQSEEEKRMTEEYLLKVWYEYDTFLPCVFHGGSWWVRVAAQVYNEEKDFEWAGKVIKEVCEGVNDGTFKRRVKGGFKL